MRSVDEGFFETSHTVYESTHALYLVNLSHKVAPLTTEVPPHMLSMDEILTGTSTLGVLGALLRSCVRRTRPTPEFGGERGVPTCGSLNLESSPQVLLTLVATSTIKKTC
ncbi:hypothetical protein SODALDRAFT_99193 [Sodiomyces alkalinus F11]|uniref:Uncharacterized protein n=1 Tax=Sodiomyces alkalinus (strain CBS 110278 / VKM F-3762 / F11) TaxID=1314773 RepID=A0A3N2Q1H4_SODAK|nr:hypothetical protein SODALDRAFT_99193 [Sodiomyces alkalinus F11]ROT40556.1 hypothetical protein SODALDRAFT_99193 [Sodiomyces alkalinus F11]